VFRTGSTGAEPENYQAWKEGWLLTVASYPILSGSDLAVAIYIGKQLYRETRTARASITKIAAAINRDDATVWKAINRLEKLGLLRVTKGKAHGAQWVHNIYTPGFGIVDIDPKYLRRRKKLSAE
jgi:hypothetical protein